MELLKAKDMKQRTLITILTLLLCALLGGVDCLAGGAQALLASYGHATLPRPRPPPSLRRRFWFNKKLLMSLTAQILP
jgi:hypothetical protein